MKAYFVLFLSISIFSCKTEIPKEFFSYPDRQEIVAITETILEENKLPVSRSPLPGDTVFNEDHTCAYLPIRFYLASDLRKLQIRVPDTARFSASGFNEVNIQKLLRLKANTKSFFSKNDSTFMLFQNDTVKTLDLDKELGSKYFITTSTKEDAKKQHGGEYYDISVPVFSKDFKKAYVEVNHHCYALCGSGHYVLLEKVNGKWTIIDTQATWVS